MTFFTFASSCMAVAWIVIDNAVQVYHEHHQVTTDLINLRSGFVRISNGMAWVANANRYHNLNLRSENIEAWQLQWQHDNINELNMAQHCSMRGNFHDNMTTCMATTFMAR